MDTLKCRKYGIHGALCNFLMAQMRNIHCHSFGIHQGVFFASVSRAKLNKHLDSEYS